jgi:putative flippase GtrA
VRSSTLVRYLLISAFTFVLDLVLLTLVHSGLGWPLPVALTLGYAVALTIVLLGVTTGLAAAGVPYQVARILAGGCEGIFMYCAMRWFVFRTTRSTASTPVAPASRRSTGQVVR